MLDGLAQKKRLTFHATEDRLQYMLLLHVPNNFRCVKVLMI